MSSLWKAPAFSRDRPYSGREYRRGSALPSGIALIMLLTSCAASANDVTVAGSTPGFWYGLWHGLIVPITFLISLLDTDVGIYAVHNSGHLYDLGFLLGAVVSLSGVFGGRAATQRSRARRQRSSADN
jgi:hypothetical protein